MACLVLVGTTACSSAPPATSSRARDLSLDPTERAVRLRLSLTELREDPLAEGSSLEILRAEAWISRAEALARTGADPALRDLLLETAEGEVVLVRSAAALRKSRLTLGPRAPVGAPREPERPRDEDEPKGAPAPSASPQRPPPNGDLP
jgi:hypothetical protein